MSSLRLDGPTHSKMCRLPLSFVCSVIDACRRSDEPDFDTSYVLWLKPIFVIHSGACRRSAEGCAASIEMWMTGRKHLIMYEISSEHVYGGVGV